AAEVPLRTVQRDRKAAFALERFEICLLRCVDLRTTPGQLGGEADFGWNGRRPVRQLGDQLSQRLRLEVEQGADSADERCSGLKAQRRAREVGALTLRDRGEVYLAVGEGQLGGRAKDRRRRLLENRVLLVLHHHLSRTRK